MYDSEKTRVYHRLRRVLCLLVDDMQESKIALGERVVRVCVFVCLPSHDAIEMKLHRYTATLQRNMSFDLELRVCE